MQPRQPKVRVVSGELFIESGPKLMKLAIDTADQPISKTRQLAQRDRRARLHDSISLLKW